jgi:uncharacterized protein (DUF433 family)
MAAKNAPDAAVSLPDPSPAPESWVEKSPDVCGGDACIRKTRITVWGLVEWRNLGLSDAEIMQHLPDLTQADLDVAWEYYNQRREEIDEAMREDTEA